MDEKVHEQGNGARIRVAQVAAPPPIPEEPDRLVGPPALQVGRPEWAREKAAERGVTPGEGGWGTSLGLGVAALIVCSLLYNMVVLMTHIDFKILATFSGAAIGFAIRAGGAQGSNTAKRLVACALTYVCLASIYVPWYYDEILHPERYAWEFEDYEAYDEGPDWDPAFDPVARPTGPVEVASLDAPAPSGPVLGVEFGALAEAVVRATIFPLIQIGWGDVLAIVWLIFAWVQAWKTSADGW